MLIDIKDLMNLLSVDNENYIISRFSHRGDDPPFYEVGLFPELNNGSKLVKPLVRNSQSGLIMDYFYDDVIDGEKIDITWLTHKEGYFIIKDKDQFILYNKKIYKDPRYIEDIINITTDWLYPKIIVGGVRYYLHKFIAKIFIPNPYPEKFNIVHHKNSNKIDFKKENLEWCDTVYNNQRENRVSSSKTGILFKNKTTGKIFTEEELLIEYPYKYVTTSIYRAVRENKTYHNDCWEIVRTDDILNEYISKYPLTNNWYSHPIYNDIEANENGVLRIHNKLTIGYISGEYYSVKTNGKRYRTHRLLAECFFKIILTNNSELEVDHIDTDKFNNQLNNLRICTHKENVNNETTKSHMKKVYTVFSCDIYGNDEQIHTGTVREIMNTSYNLGESNIHRDTVNNGRIYYTTQEEKLKKLSRITKRHISRQKQNNNNKDNKNENK